MAAPPKNTNILLYVYMYSETNATRLKFPPMEHSQDPRDHTDRRGGGSAPAMSVRAVATQYDR